MNKESIHLPKPVAAYFDAEKVNSAAIARCFTDEAIVKDEGHTYHGRAAIEQWRDGVAAKYELTSEPFACEEKDGKCVVTSRLTGNFPGSPLDLRFFFTLEGDKIAALEIIP